MTEKKPYIKVSRRVTLVTEVPYDEDHYPGMSLAEAIRHEEKLSTGEKLQAFCEEIEFAGDRAAISENVSVVYYKAVEKNE